tara:strand:+ start:1334 stop:1501 length:168 start_codon:yes stop_codon:yes gene_type:complete
VVTFILLEVVAVALIVVLILAYMEEMVVDKVVELVAVMLVKTRQLTPEAVEAVVV